MKRILPILFCALLISSCSFDVNQLTGFLSPSATPAPTLVPTDTLVPLPTFTPTLYTPTYTPTPTMVGYKSPTPTPESTATPQITETPTPVGVSALTNPDVSLDGFVSVSVSEPVFYRRGPCEPGKVKFTAQVGEPQKAAFVVLSVRFSNKETGFNGKWVGITMDKNGLGTFTYELVPGDVKGLDFFTNPWVQYQLVVTDSKSNVIGRTGIFKDTLTLLDCLPTATPTVTQTPLKP